MPARKPKPPPRAETYQHPDEAVLRPEVGTQATFKKKREPRTYRYDSSLSPALNWDGQNPTRELGEWLLLQLRQAADLDPPREFDQPRRFGEVVVTGFDDAVNQLSAISAPFLDWAGKAEHLSFDVPTLPLFVHERLSTKAILETLKGHERDQQLEWQLFGDPRLSLTQQLEAYEHTGGWVNRLILGDSLVVMNSLLEYEGLGGQVQMIYTDPPYGVKFGSNFQPFVRRRDVRDGADDDLTREPEMVQAYRDTWELGVHSYLTYLRDRLRVARELLADSGSIFVQIGDENVHLVRDILDEVFGSENFVSLITVKKTGGLGTDLLKNVTDYVVWYAVDRRRLKYRKLLSRKRQGIGESTGARYDQVLLPTGEVRPLTTEERRNPEAIPDGARTFQLDNLVSSGTTPSCVFDYEYEGEVYSPGGQRSWKTNRSGMEILDRLGRLSAAGRTLRYVRFLDDFAAFELNNVWDDVAVGTDKLYVVQTPLSVVERCVLMTTDPGDLVLDPTCGSGTTAYASELWGRRWITADTSRVPLALARQRLLTATFPYFELQDSDRGPGSGFVYRRRQNSRGEEVGGIVPHVTLRSLANEEPPDEEILVDQPETKKDVTRVCGSFCVEANIPTPLDSEDESEDDHSYVDRMIEVLKRSPVIQLAGGKSLTLDHVRVPSKSLTIAAEATVESSSEPIAFVFGPEHGAVVEKLVYEAAREARARSYGQLIVIGFAIEASARELVEKSADLVDIPVTYVQATPDLVMGDLLKTMRSSQIFSVTGLPDVVVRRLPPESKGATAPYEVELQGLDVFDPATMASSHRNGDDVPAWFLDTNYNDLCFHVSQAFFPRTSAWDSLKRSLKGTYDESVWDHLAGTLSAPFLPGDSRKIAVKVIDDRGNELLVVKSLDEAS